MKVRQIERNTLLPKLLPDADVRAFVDNLDVKNALDKEGKSGTVERVRAAAGDGPRGGAR